MNEMDMSVLVAIGGTLTTGVMSLIKRFYPDLSDWWKGIIVLLLSLATVWGYEIYRLGFENLLDDPWGAFLRMLAVTGFAVSLYQILLKPATVSQRIEGTFEKEE